MRTRLWEGDIYPDDRVKADVAYAGRDGVFELGGTRSRLPFKECDKRRRRGANAV